jgi:dTDP-4-amino-4,6-dideoxygalactose transaminase
MSDLGAEYRSLQGEIDEAIRRVLASGRYALGPELEAFEAEFAAYCGTAHAVGVASGTAAVHLALIAAGIGPGDEVITVPNTDTPTVMAISHTGAKAVWVDTDPRTFNLDPSLLERAMTPKTRAILPVHLFGHPVDMTPVLEIADRRGIPVIEDAALAAGALCDGRRAGGMGRIGCFSLAPGKVFGGYGDGGIVVTNDAAIADRVRVLRNYGHAPEMSLDERSLIGTESWLVLEEGYNERLDEVWAAVLRAKLRTLDERIDLRRAAAAAYSERLAGLPLITPTEAPYARHAYHSYQVLVDDRDTARRFLADRGIATRLFYIPPLHLQPAYARLGFGPGSFPVTESTSSRMFALPLFPQISEDQIDEVVGVLAEYLGQNSTDG